VRHRDGVQSPPSLKQEGQRRAVEPFGVVIPGDQRQPFVAIPDALDDSGENVGQFRADDQQPFLVGLGRGDPQAPPAA
jgi:hypothetical protein